ncbi:MAG TPA: HEAT repeat domain-containing protein, partial [Longimicrobiaceae bacterium]|nr:HEAT repeat domain-containing protein [Longimicrobiaceae bacterium]
ALPPPVLRGVRALFGRLSGPEAIQELVRAVEESEGREGLVALLSFFPPDALPSLLRASETTRVEGVRGAILAAAERLAGKEGERLLPLLGNPDALIATAATRLASRRKLEAAAPEIARQLTRPEMSLRLAAVEALQELRTSVAAQALLGVLEDPEREVRVAAARALAALRYTPARPALEEALASRRLREAELSERIAFFEAYGSVAGEEEVGMLERILNGKSWLGRRESSEMRACAALGLGRAALPSARRALAAAAADTDPVVRSAVGRALRGSEP